MMSQVRYEIDAATRLPDLAGEPETYVSGH
jgi:hypothetical protein